MNIIGDDIPCPFDDEVAPLRGRKLTAQEKTWLATMVLTQKMTVAYLRAKYQLSSRRLWEYVQRVRSGISFHEKGGRPKALDSVSQNICIARAQQEPKLSYDELRELLNAEYRNTIQRRWPKLRPDDPMFGKHMAKRTMIKYVALYRTHEPRTDGTNGKSGILLVVIHHIIHF